MEKLSDKIDKEIYEQGITVMLSKHVVACSTIVKDAKGILISIKNEDEPSDVSWRKAHEVTHLNNYSSTMYRPGDGKEIIKDKEELTNILAIKNYLPEDDILDELVKNDGNMEETASSMGVPLEVLYRAMHWYNETSEHYRRRSMEITSTYGWAQD